MDKVYWAVAVAVSAGIVRYLALLAMFRVEPLRGGLWLNLLAGIIVGLLAWTLAQELFTTFRSRLLCLTLLAGIIGAGFTAASNYLLGGIVHPWTILYELAFWGIVGLCAGLLAWLLRPAAERP